jgi:arginyl-tRNA synthetase
MKSIFEIDSYLEDKILNAVKKAGFYTDPFPPIEITLPKQKEYGDASSNIALKLVSQFKKNPREIAQGIKDALDLDPKVIDKIELAGPGFLNFTFSLDLLFSSLRVILKEKSDYGRQIFGKGRKAQVEFVSANPTGPLTIGHGRQAVLGDTIARLLEASGYTVTREYYYNDAGRQMRVLGDSVYLRYLECLGETIDFPEDYYQGDYIREIALKAKDEKGDALKGADNSEYFTELAEKMIFQDIQNTLKRLGIFFDIYFNEKSLYESGQIEKILKAFREKDLSYEKDGALWFRLSSLGKDDRVIVKSTGEPTYRLPDMAYHRDKLERGFDLIVDIFGADHADTYPDVLAGVQALGYDTTKVKVLIHQFVTLLEGKEKVKMSTRKANFVTLDELMDEVGVDVTRYFFLNRSMSGHLNFDLTLAKTQSDENPVYYIQYAHARICSILRHAEKEGVDLNSEADLSLLRIPEEQELIKILLQYPKVVKGSTEEYEPHRICTYLEEVATVYHRFQHAGKVHDTLRVVTDNIPVTLARLALCRAVRIVLANGLSLLGLSRPEKM